MVKKTSFFKERIDGMIKYQSYSKLAEKLDINISGLRKYILRAVKQGFLKQVKGVWVEGDRYLSGTPHNGHHNGHFIELHGVEIKFPILDPPSWWRNNKQIYREFRPFQDSVLGETPNVVMKQHYFDFCDVSYFRVRTTTKSIILVQKADMPLRGESAKELKKYLIDLAFKFAPVLEKKFLVKLGDVDGVCITLNKQHYAHLKNSIAKEFLRENVALNVFVDGRLRTLVDRSKGVMHFEHVSAIHSDLDAEKWERLIANVNTGKFDEEKVLDDIDTVNGRLAGFERGADKMLAVVEGVADNQVMFDKNFQSHLSAVRALGSGVKELTGVIKKMDAELVGRIEKAVKEAKEKLGDDSVFPKAKKSDWLDFTWEQIIK